MNWGRGRNRVCHTVTATKSQHRENYKPAPRIKGDAIIAINIHIFIPSHLCSTFVRLQDMFPPPWWESEAMKNPTVHSSLKKNNEKEIGFLFYFGVEFKDQIKGSGLLYDVCKHREAV